MHTCMHVASTLLFSIIKNYAWIVTMHVTHMTVIDDSNTWQFVVTIYLQKEACMVFYFGHRNVCSKFAFKLIIAPASLFLWPIKFCPAVHSKHITCSVRLVTLICVCQPKMPVQWVKGVYGVPLLVFDAICMDLPDVLRYTLITYYT